MAYLNKKDRQALELLKRWQASPLAFIKSMWGLEPQAGEYEKGKHITWQQYEILLAVEKAIRGEAKKRISIASGHGIGKSTVLSWIMWWFLMTHKDAQVACTAPTSDQLYDVLWKEAAKWQSLMPPAFGQQFEMTQDRIRQRQRPEIWFARARTARKETPEALAGLHGDWVLYLVDEASGVDDAIFRTAEGALTGPNILVIMTSNPTRLLGYFADSHNPERDGKNWQTFSFSSLDSPLVEKDYVDRIKAKHGEDSDEYRIRVLGRFPREDAMDEKGYVPLFMHQDIHMVPDLGALSTPKLGVDPAGEGRNETIWVIRDNFKAKIAAIEKESNTKSIARKTLTLMDYYGVLPDDTYVDNFGVGANVAQELALAQGIRVNGVNVGEQADDMERFINRRAECYWRMKEWARAGGEFVRHDRWEQLHSIRYRREVDGRIKVMSKQEMRREGYPSPDAPDALSLTFISPSQSASFQSEDLSDDEINDMVNVY